MNKLKSMIPITVVILACSAMTYTPKTVTESKGTEIKTKSETVSVTVGDTTKWVAPASEESIKNPITSNETSVAAGVLVYKKNCRSCHGKDGDGMGAEAADLKTKPTDFRNLDFAKQSDGSMFWKIQKGRGDMTAFEKDLSADDVWNVVNYIRTFSQPVQK